MFDSAEVRDLAHQVQAICTGLEPAALAGSEVGKVFDALVAMRRLVDGAITRLTPAYERSGSWRDRGATDAVAAIAAATGTTPADTRRRMTTGSALQDRPGLDDAVKQGAVSTEQANVIATTPAQADVDEDLIDVARHKSHTDLRHEAARARAAGDHDDAARRDRQRRLRSARRWTDDDGLYNLHLRTLPEHGAQIDAHLKPVTDQHFDRARREGRHEPIPAYVADAVVDILATPAGVCTHTSGDASAGAGCRPSRGSGAVRPERKVIALVDIDALRRGRTENGETCELAGVGPVSVAAVRALFGDAATAVIFRDAVDIRSVVHLGRQVTATQRTALEARRARCGVCGSTHQLEIDHTVGWTYTRVTTIDHLDWLCSACHDLKTRRNLLAIGPPGQRTLVERDPTDPTRPATPIRQIAPRPDRTLAGLDPPAPPGSTPAGGLTQPSFRFAT